MKHTPFVKTVVFACLFILASVFASAVSVNQGATAATGLFCSAPDTYIIQWTAEGIVQPHLENTVDVDPYSYAKGETWECSAYERVYDALNHAFTDEFRGSDSVVIQNAVPVITSTAVTTVNAGSLYTYQVLATDADTDALTFSLTTAPAGMTISPNGLIQWATIAANAGLHPITVQVTDGDAVVTQSYTLTVNSIASPVTVTGTATPNAGNAPLVVAFTASAVGGTGPYNYAWDFTNDGTFDSVAQNPSFTYAAAGTYTARVFATDSASNNDDFFITVVVTPAGSALAVTPSATPTTGSSPLAVAFNAVASGGNPGYSYRWDFTNDGSYDALVANPSFTYTAAGTYTARVNVTDAASNTAQALVTITVTGTSSAPTFTVTSCPNAEVDKSYTCDINATGATSYSLTAAPTNMTINSATGVISWKPTKEGSYSFTVRASNGALFTDRTFTISVNGEDDESASEDDLFVESIEFANERPSQGDEVRAYVTLENEGDLDFEDLTIKMSIDDLDVSDEIAKFDLNDGKKVTKEIALDLPYSIVEGYYTVKFTIKNDDVTVIKYKDLYIKGTKVAGTNTVTSQSDVVVQSNIEGYQPPAGSARINWLGIWFMIMLFILLLALAIYLAKKAREGKTEAEQPAIMALDNDFV